MSNKLLPYIPEDLPSEQIPILVVDDTQDNLDLIEALLVCEGFEKVYQALSGQEALGLLQKQHDIGVVLLDMMMPGMDGHEVCRRITTDEVSRHIPVIIVTGGALRMNEALQKSFAAGAVDFVTKPVNEVELLMRVRSALALYRERVMRHHATYELAESEEKFRITFDQAPVGIAHVDAHGQLLLVNHRLCEMLGYSHGELMNLHFQTLCGVPAWQTHEQHLEPLLSGDAEYHAYELPLFHKEHKNIWTHLTVSPLREPEGSLKYFIYVIEDITERKEAEESLRLAATVFESSTEAIIITDTQANILKVNSAFTTITGYALEEVTGTLPDLLNSGKSDSDFQQNVWASLNETGQWQGEIWNRRKNGDVYPAWITLCTVRNEKDAITNYVAIFRDITLRKEAEERLSYLATHDALTDLPNRVLLHDRVTHALAQAQRYKRKLAILFLDLDRFKVINDTLGHGVGDRLLQTVVTRLTSSLRKSDTIARWGGDEFVILLERINTIQDTVVVSRKILDLLSKPYVIEGNEIFVTGSIGISLYPKDGEDVQTLLRNADAAMYRSKEQGRNSYQFYTAEMNASAYQRLRLEADLRHALERDEFILHYQPKIDLATGQLSGIEALIRWQHPIRGLLPPKEFIPLAEETGLIVPIGEWVLRTACAQNQHWRTAGIASIPMAVNLSNHQFSRNDLAQNIDRILRETGLDPSLLQLEITESTMMEDIENAVSTLNNLSSLGVEVCMDDFGTGYSSLGYLKRFPIRILKISRSFVAHIPSDPDDTSIARAIISLAHSLKLKVTAEGIETEEQLSFFREHQCDEAQGFLFSHPLPVDEITTLLIKSDTPGAFLKTAY